MSVPLLRIRGLKKSFGRTEVLRGIDLDVSRGECIAILGPSGSGKSSLLRCVNLLDPATAGSIRFGEEEVTALPRAREPQLRSRIGMVFQNFELFNHLTAEENIMLAPMQVRGLDKASARTLAASLLARVHLPDHAGHFPDELSGGQQQRVAIARALAMQPELLLFDEPTSALDPEMVREVLDVISELAGAGLTSLVVTHEVGFARSVADRVVFIDEGQVMEEGPPQAVLDAPRNPRTRAFLGGLLR